MNFFKTYGRKISNDKDTNEVKPRMEHIDQTNDPRVRFHRQMTAAIREARKNAMNESEQVQVESCRPGM